MQSVRSIPISGSATCTSRTVDIDRVREFYVGILGFDVVHEARDVPFALGTARSGTGGPRLPAAITITSASITRWKPGRRPTAQELDRFMGLHHVALNSLVEAS